MKKVYVDVDAKWLKEGLIVPVAIYWQMGQDAVDKVNRRKIVSYDVLAKEIGQGSWGDNAGVIRVLITFKKYEWSRVQEACKKNNVKIKWS